MKVTGIDKTAVLIPDGLELRGRSQKLEIGEFKRTLDAELSSKTKLKFSNHALDRLAGRSVRLDDQTVDRLDKAVSVADKKGAAQSLVLLDELAFLISVKNKTVITAMETNRMKESVFTQIDSTVIG